MYQSLIIFLFGESLFILKLFNVVYSVGITIFIYKIATRLFHESIGRIRGIVYALFIPSIVMCSVLTNQHIATFFFFLGFNFLIKYWETNSPFVWLWSGLFIGLGNIMRPIGSIVLLAIAIYILLVMKNGRDQTWQRLKRLAGVVAVYFAVQLTVNQLFIAMDITDYPLSNQEPYWRNSF